MKRRFFLCSQEQTSARVFNTPMPAGTPESEWGAVSAFDHYEGMGDAAIWTGSALNAFILRYMVTGTEADYAFDEEDAVGKDTIEERKARVERCDNPGGYM